LDHKTQDAIILADFEYLGTDRARQMRHIDPGHGVCGEKPDLNSGGGIFQSPPQAKAGNRAVMAPRVDDKITQRGHRRENKTRHTEV
jgi:hypothetical protein